MLNVLNLKSLGIKPRKFLMSAQLIMFFKIRNQNLLIFKSVKVLYSFGDVLISVELFILKLKWDPMNSVALQRTLNREFNLVTWL